jgi:hypothetical protein
MAQIRSETFQLPIWAFNNHFAGRPNRAGYLPDKVYHIHIRNRAYVWKRDHQLGLLDSILKGIQIPSIVVSEKDGKRWIMDGGQRTTTIKRILDGDVRTLSSQELELVRSAPISIQVYYGLSSSQEREIFIRLNKSVKVSDGQQYEMSQDDSPLVKYSLKLLNDPTYPLRDLITDCFFDTQDQDNEKRSNLENAVALVSGAKNGVDFITKSFIRQSEQVEKTIFSVEDEERVVYNLGVIFGIFKLADMRKELTHKSSRRAQWPIGKYMGAMLYDVITNPNELTRIQEKWINYLVMVRTIKEAEEAIDVGSSKNMTADRLQKISIKVQVYITSGKLMSKTELYHTLHNSDSEEE